MTIFFKETQKGLLHHWAIDVNLPREKILQDLQKTYPDFQVVFPDGTIYDTHSAKSLGLPALHPWKMDTTYYNLLEKNKDKMTQYRFVQILHKERSNEK